jgi:carbamate kinase
MDIVGAMTQGQIGYMLQHEMSNALSELGNDRLVCAVVNRVEVNANDPEFEGETASKPVGNFLTEEEANEIKSKHPDYIMKKVKPNGDRVWRRTVPSPDPIQNVEKEALKKMVDAGLIVIASGGGGIPVVRRNDGSLAGVEAVIDKDLSGEKLAEEIEADTYLVLTDVDRVYLNYGTEDQKALDTLTLSQAKSYHEEGHFLAGSMGPKVLACIRFVESGGKEAIITSLDKADSALEGGSGTHIIRDA